MTKSDLLGVYRTSLSTCGLAYASLVLWAYPDTPAFFEAMLAQMDVPKPHAELMPMLNDERARKIAAEELYNTAHRAALKQLFELTKAYCAASNQLPALEAQPWFQFWRILRNSFSHDMHFHFNNYDRAQLPVTWSDVTLDLSLEGKPLTHGQFSRETLREFLGTVGQYVEAELA